jgi:hypothetical protein
MVTSRKWRLQGMRTFALVGLALGLGIAPVVRADPPANAKKQKPKQVVPTGKEDAAPPTQADILAEQELERMTNRSTEGLVQVQHGNGMVSMDLEDRFMHVMKVVPDGKGGTRIVCTDDHAASKLAPPVSNPPAALEEK